MKPLVHTSQVSRAAIDSGSHCLVRTSSLTVSGDMLNPTYASERPPCTQLYNQYNVSLFSTYARQLTTQHHLLCWTWQLESVSMCQYVVRRHCIRHTVHESAALKDRHVLHRQENEKHLALIARKYISRCNRDSCIPRRPDEDREDPTS